MLFRSLWHLGTIHPVLGWNRTRWTPTIGNNRKDAAMEWFTANWFSVVIFGAFVAMHVFGHGGHGGHGGHRDGDRQRRRGDADTDGARGRRVNTTAGGHQH